MRGFYQLEDFQGYFLVGQKPLLIKTQFLLIIQLLYRLGYFSVPFNLILKMEHNS